MAVVRTGRPAVTRYRVLERMTAHALVEASLVTGRTHQIRVHFAHLGHPVAGDPVYGRRGPEARRLGLSRQALHAFRLRFRHPRTGAEAAFEAPPPADFTAAVARARAEGAGPVRRSGRTRR
jgi:23S rRNA pseudouridine1911/1915/1917 synthase